MKSKLQFRDIFILYILAGLGIARAFDIAILAGFTNYTYARKRLYFLMKLELIGCECLDREKIYYLTYKGYREIERMHRTYEINSTTLHDVEVARIASYLYLTHGISYMDMLTDRQMKFLMKGSKIHRPDIVVESTSYEYERTLKTWQQLRQNVKANSRFEKQVWIVPDNKKTIQERILNFAKESLIENVEVLKLSEVNDVVKNFNLKDNELRSEPILGERNYELLTQNNNSELNKYLH